MIIWLASYPKSGNTLIRSMLAAYFFSSDGKFNFKLLDNIKQFPDNSVLRNLGINTSDENEVVKNYIKAQEEINRRDGKSIRFLKTHSTLNNINGNPFTDLKNSLGVIYIVRDPRKIVSSYANHSVLTLEQAQKRILEVSTLGGKNELINKTIIHAGSWSSNYHSWKEFKKIDRYLLIKYEDLVSEPEKTFTEALKFIYKLTKANDVINNVKLTNTLDTTKFKYLQNLEEKDGFKEATFGEGDQKNKFFKYGPKNDGKKNIPSDLRKNLEKILNKEMQELGYL
tara:strand:- start:900 stop:1748 length:849 start_codon:yes stop_codon:yes gene_type:complete